VTLVDANILLDLFTNDPQWAAWSANELDRLSLAGPLLINDVVYAELSVRFTTVEEIDEAFIAADIALAPIPRRALFLAGKAYRRYRVSGGQRTGVLPDFFIGAHAAAAGLPLLTRDAKRYRTYFPAIELITP